jgi:Cyclin, C-terminal domain
MDKHSGYTVENLSSCYHVFESLVKSMNSSQLKAVYRKFKSGKFFEVARLAQQVVTSSATTKPNSAATGGSTNVSAVSQASSTIPAPSIDWDKGMKLFM